MTGAVRRLPLFVVGSVLTWAASVGAQSTPDPRAAQPERPTVATHAFVVAPGVFELEAGIQLHDEFDAPGLLKIGVAPRLQLDVAPAWFGDDKTPPTESGFLDTTIGVKWHVADDLPLLHAFALQPAVTIPTGSVDDGTGSGVASLSLIVISSRTIHGASLDINIGGTLSGQPAAVPRTSSMWAVAAGIPFISWLIWDAEVFGYPGTAGDAGAPPVVGLLTGPALVVRKELVLDFGGIFNVEGFGAPAFYAGLTWNIGRLWTPGSSKGPVSAIGRASAFRRRLEPATVGPH